MQLVRIIQSNKQIKQQADRILPNKQQPKRAGIWKTRGSFSAGRSRDVLRGVIFGGVAKWQVLQNRALLSHE